MRSLISFGPVTVNDNDLQRIRKGVDLAIRLGEQNMTAISDLAANVAQSFSDIESAMDGIAADINAQKGLILQLQSSAGGALSPEDMALLNGIGQRADAIRQRAQGIDQIVDTPPAPQA